MAVHAVDGLTPGAYRCSQGDFQLLRAGAERHRTHALCLGQDLGGDSAATVFHCARLEPILQALGARGYRARPAGGRHRRGAAATGGVHARLWRHRAHLLGRRRLGVLRHPRRTDAGRRGRRPRLSGTDRQAPGPAALRQPGGGLTALGTSRHPIDVRGLRRLPQPRQARNPSDRRAAAVAVRTPQGRHPGAAARPPRPARRPRGHRPAGAGPWLDGARLPTCWQACPTVTRSSRPAMAPGGA